MSARWSAARARAVPFALAALLALCGCAADGDGHGAGRARAASASGADGDAVFALAAAAEGAYRDGRWIDAERHYRRLAEAVPDDAWAWFRLGNVYVRQGDWERAIDAYERSIERDAEQPRPWFNLSIAYLLRARDAMERARRRLRADDPARAIIERRIDALGALLHERIEDGAAPTSSR